MRIPLAVAALCLCFSSLAFAEGEPEPAEAAAPEAAAEALKENPIYGETLRQLVGIAREKVLARLEEKTLAKQEAKMERVRTAFSLFGLLGGAALLFSPLYFR